MDINKIKWCFDLKTGLSFVNPNENLSEIYLETSKFSKKRLRRVKGNYFSSVFCTPINNYTQHRLSSSLYIYRTCGIDVLSK